MNGQDTKITYLKDYTVPTYLIEHCSLKFKLGAYATQVDAQLRIKRNPKSDDTSRNLSLDGENLTLLALLMDGEAVDTADYEVTGTKLTLNDVPDECLLEITTEIKPQENESLNGLYVSNGMFCTQCEPHGFRHITYYLDRPDVMTTFTTTIIADKSEYPVLLSNGNPIAQGEFEDGKHWAKWEDPFKKPSYLFALVAGKLAKIEDSFTTCSGREVAIHFFVEEENKQKCQHAIASLKRAMAWDEQCYDREYDLDIYMVVAVNDFNMGAMENKGLNIFNSKYVLAAPKTATDTDYQNIEAVVAHEYFHNWTGNRITCRDWFQLSLKEGLTVFRDQSFSQDMGATDVKRIDDVILLKTRQFAEDAGPMSHPIRPDSFIEINNFYTLTIYEKGAEVIRMLQTLIGKKAFFKGMNYYFKHFDEQAVTTEEFIVSMERANGLDLKHFRQWYTQSGTPKVTINTSYDGAAQTFTLRCHQETLPTADQKEKAPLHIPIKMALLDEEGRAIPLRVGGKDLGDETKLELHQSEEEFVFEQVASKPVPSLFRGFSAIVDAKVDYSDEQLAFLLRHDQDPYNRWDAGAQLFTRVLLGLISEHDQKNQWALPELATHTFEQLLKSEQTDPSFLARLLTLPSESFLAQQCDVVDPIAIYEARQWLLTQLSQQFAEQWATLYQQYHDPKYQNDSEHIARRALKNVALYYLAATQDATQLAVAKTQYQESQNMTDTMTALTALTHYASPQLSQKVLDDFSAKWEHDPLVMDKWFALQACANRSESLSTVKDLMTHTAFSLKNPNKVYALIGGFAGQNALGFHAVDGSGYKFLSDVIRQLNDFNPQVASRMCQAFTQWRRYAPSRQALMREQLEHLQTQKLSKDVYELVTKSLDAA